MPLDALTRCADARPVVMGGLARAMVPPPRLGVAEWAERHRVVGTESGSRYPGPWRNDRAPHLVEIMDALGPDDPCEDVVFVKSAQIGGSEAGINFIAYVIAQAPGPMIAVLPSHDEAVKYVRTKLQPAIDETPALRSRVFELTNKAERGSTAAYKRFRGGFLQTTFAGSSKGLQMLSARWTLADEVSEWPAEAGERGDPVAQLKVRTKIYERDRKRFWVSTPSVAGTCRISAMYESSDKRRRYVPCPHCGAFQVLRFERLKWDSETAPHGAWMECAMNGCVMTHLDKPAMLARGVWIATAAEEAPPECLAAEEIDHWRGRPPTGLVRGYHLWQAYNTFASWDNVVAEYLAARGNHEQLRVFTQQVLGEPWEDRGDAPEAERLHAARVTEFAKGRPPVGPVVFTGAVDVQGNRLEWAVWGWSEGMTRWLVDWGVVPGDPSEPAVWAEMARVMQACRYAPGGAAATDVEAWAVDTGFHSQHVYNFCRGRPRVFAVDGRGKKNSRIEPFIGTPKKMDIKLNGKRIPRGVLLWPLGTFPLKSDLYASIRRSIAGRNEDGQWAAGAMILPDEADVAYCEQLTAEHLVQKELRSGVRVEVWEKLSGRPNEALDIACYARAMAHHLKLDRLTPEQWAALRADRAGDTGVQADLFAIEVAPPVAVPKPERKTTQKRRGWRN